MEELAFAARHLSASADGPNTVFHFTDESGKILVLSLNGIVDPDFVGRCRLYYEPETPVPDSPVQCGTITEFSSLDLQNDMILTSSLLFTVEEILLSPEESDAANDEQVLDWLDAELRDLTVF